jgi:hypothetical protein
MAAGTAIRVLLVIAAAGVLALLIAQYSKKAENFAAPATHVDQPPPAAEPRSPHYGPEASGAPTRAAAPEPSPAARITAEDLLPKDAANSAWAQANPAGQGDVQGRNFLSAGFHLGTNTQGSSLRNASHDLRSTPPNPRLKVSVWSQSTIEPDMGRRPLE